MGHSSAQNLPKQKISVRTLKMLSCEAFSMLVLQAKLLHMLRAGLGAVWGHVWAQAWGLAQGLAMAQQGL